jgi:hypothetical protein
MFFLGGLNSILPYLLYLSLLWICLIIGFTGNIDRIRHFLKPETEITAQPETHSCKSKIIQYQQVQVKEKINPGEFIHQETLATTLVPNISIREPDPDPLFLFTDYINNTFSFRGPPLPVS